MSRYYITDKQVGRYFWLFEFSHSAMSNHMPAHMNRELATSFDIVHGTITYPHVWFETFTVGKFPQSKDGLLLC